MKHPFPFKQTGRMLPVIIAGAIVVVILIALSMTVFIQDDASQSEEEATSIATEYKAALSRDYAPLAGDPNAKVHIVEFIDPACETCALFYPLVKQWIDEMPGKIKLSIRHVPFHTGADYAVRVLEASREQDKYWQTLEALLESQRVWTQNHRVIAERIVPAITHVGLDTDKLLEDINRMDVLQRMEQDQQDAIFLQVRATPQYYVNDRMLTEFGAQQLANLVREELLKAYPEMAQQ